MNSNGVGTRWHEKWAALMEVTDNLAVLPVERGSMGHILGLALRDLLAQHAERSADIAYVRSRCAEIAGGLLTLRLLALSGRHISVAVIDEVNGKCGGDVAPWRELIEAAREWHKGTATRHDADRLDAAILACGIGGE